jgi:hypothetical protein
MDSSVKESIKSKKFNVQNILEIRDMKRQNLWTIEIQEEEDTQARGAENIFNRIIEENIPNLKRERDAYQGTKGIQNPKETEPEKKLTSWHIITKILILQNKERILKRCKGKIWSDIKRQVHLTFQWSPWKSEGPGWMFYKL